MSSEIIGYGMASCGEGRYFTKDCDRSLFVSHNPLDIRIVHTRDYIHTGESVLNPTMHTVVLDDLLYGFAIAIKLKK
jgi:hypothetical protein